MHTLFVSEDSFSRRAAGKVITQLMLLAVVLLLGTVICASAYAGPREQAKRIHDRLAGVPPSAATLDAMAELIQSGTGSDAQNAEAAAMLATEHPDFYRTTLKNFAAPWTNRDQSIFVPLNDYSATIIGIVRDDIDFREILSGDILYTDDGSSGVAAYSQTSNLHYEQLEDEGVDLGEHLQQQQQSILLNIPADATAGVMTSRAAAREFFIAGTNRAMFRFTLINHLCRDLESLADTTRAPDRIRQDVTRSPGGDSRVFRNNCIGCHSGMDPMAQAFAYYNYSFDAESDPEGNAGQLTYNNNGAADVVTGTRVVAKYHNNASNFPFGYVTQTDDWNNYWRAGRNQNVGWSPSLPGAGSGAKTMGTELANSNAFASCQVIKVFRNVCLRDPAEATDRNEIQVLTQSFTSNGFNLKRTFASVASYCRGQ
ncbi:MAG: hypothetical protein ACI9UN_004110 [Granulosicoccus sp.]|jgi:hypothetical protein